MYNIIMKNPFALTIFLNALLVFPGYLVASSDTIVEGETSLPLAYDVDVLVAGGSLGGSRLCRIGQGCIRSGH
jgi:hypothetical protein